MTAGDVDRDQSHAVEIPQIYPLLPGSPVPFLHSSPLLGASRSSGTFTILTPFHALLTFSLSSFVPLPPLHTCHCHHLPLVLALPLHPHTLTPPLPPPHTPTYTRHPPLLSLVLALPFTPHLLPPSYLSPIPHLSTPSHVPDTPLLSCFTPSHLTPPWLASFTPQTFSPSTSHPLIHTAHTAPPHLTFWNPLLLLTLPPLMPLQSHLPLPSLSLSLFSPTYSPPSMTIRAKCLLVTSWALESDS